MNKYSKDQRIVLKLFTGRSAGSENEKSPLEARSDIRQRMGLPKMKKSGCVIIALFACRSVRACLSTCCSSRRLVGVTRDSSNVTAQAGFCVRREFEEVLVKDGTTAGQKIAVIPWRALSPIINPVASARMWFRASRMHSSKLGADAQVKAVVISVDSPGRRDYRRPTSSTTAQENSARRSPR